MSIQSNINQMLSIAGLLISQNPTVKAKTEKKAQSEALKKRDVEIEKALAVSEGKNKQLSHELTGELSQIRKKEFVTNPTAESLGAYQDTSKKLSKYEKASKSARNNLKNKQNEKREGRRNFSQYIANEPTSLGVNVSQLGVEARRFIESQYTPKERKALMDRKDDKNG